MTNTVTVSVSSGPYAVGQAIGVTGTVSPSTDAVQIQLAGQGTTLPSGAWNSTTLANGAFSGTLTPVAPGTWYVWAYDPATGAQAVSGALTVPVTSGSTVQAVPIKASVVASLLGGGAAGDTPDELPAAVAASDSDTAIVAQSGKVLFAQTFAAIWTWIAGHLPGYLLPQVPITASVALDNSQHNGRLLVVTASGVTLSVLSNSIGPGFACDLMNASGATIALSGITRSAGGTTIPAGAQGRIIAYSVNGTTYMNTNA